MREDLPTGTVTLLFTDVAGSTKLLHELGDGGYGEALATHRRVIREACARHHGVEVRKRGHGAAQESNLPSRGLHDRTGFEDRLGHRAHAAPSGRS